MGKAIWFRMRNQLKILLCACVGAFAFGALICFLVVKINAGESDLTTALIATFLAILAVVAVIIIAGGVGIQSDFYLALSMGDTRKRFLLEEGAISVLLTAIGTLLCYLLFYLDGWLLRTCYPGIPVDQELDMSVVFAFLFKNPVNLLCVVVALIAIRLLIGALYMRFGQWAFWGIWLVCMTIGMLGGRMEDILHNSSEGVMQMMRTLSQLAASLHGLFFQVLVIVLSLIAVLASVLMLRKQEVKG